MRTTIGSLCLIGMLPFLVGAEQPAGFSACYVQTALDGAGNIHMIYVNAPWNDLYYRRYDAQTQSWSPPFYLANSSPAALAFSYGDIAVGTDGIPHVVYGKETGSYPNDLELITYAHATDQACTSWVYHSIGYDGYRRATPDIALDENNQPHIVYQLTNKYQPWWYRIVYRRPNGTEVVITQTSHPDKCMRPQIAYRNGIVHIAWIHPTGGSMNVMYAAAPPNGSFVPTQLSDHGWGRYIQSPGMGIAPDGTVQIVYLVANWSGSPYYQGLYLTQPGWTNGIILEDLQTPIPGGDETEDHLPPNIAFDQAGNRYVGWEHVSRNQHYYKRNTEPRVTFSPYGYIDVCGGSAGAYYVRTSGFPGPVYFERVAIGGGNVPPTLTLLTPPAANAEANTSYTIQWVDSDPDDNATISLFYDTNNYGYDGVPIPGAQSIQEDPDGAGDQFIWNISSLPDDAIYWVYGKITDGVNLDVYSYSPGYLLVNHVNDPPTIQITAPAASDTAWTGSYVIRWTDGDPDDDATISLYSSPVDAPTESTLIVGGLSEDDESDLYAWNVAGVPQGTYRIYAKVSDGEATTVAHSVGTVTVLLTVTFPPVDDASVYVWDPNQPHGSLPELDYEGSDAGVPAEMAFLKFQVSGLTSAVVRAQLVVYCTGEGGGGGLHRVLSNAWTEGTLTWNNMPSIDPVPLSTIPWVNTGVWYRYGATAAVPGNGTYSFALRSTNPDGAHVASKENPNASLRPYLEVLVGGVLPELPPTAHIDSIVPNPVIQGFHPQVSFWGSGWDNDEGGQSITAWRWVSSLNGVIGTSASFSLVPSALSVGTHTITLTVQDDEGEWSPPDAWSLEVRPPDLQPPTWPNGTGVLAVQDLANGGSVRVFWNAATDANPPVRYNVYYATTSPAFAGTCLYNVAWVPGGAYSCSFVIDGLPVCVPHVFGVRAQDAVGNEDQNTVELVGTPTQGSEGVYLPSDDAYVTSAMPDANFGSSTLLRHGLSRISYLRFVVPDGVPVASASLLLVASSSGDSATVWPVASNTWEEETITWNTRPFLGGTALGGITPQVLGGTYVVDLSSHIAAPGTYSIGINGPTQAGGSFCSKEHADPESRPRLIVTFLGDTESPSQVAGLTCTPAGSALVLSWQPATDNVGVAGYRVYRSTSAHFSPLPATLVATTQGTTYVESGVLGEPEVHHFYVVTAFDDACNESEPSDSVGEIEYELME